MTEYSTVQDVRTARETGMQRLSRILTLSFTGDVDLPKQEEFKTTRTFYYKRAMAVDY